MSDPYEVREYPQDLRFFGVWDTVRDAWAKKPYEEAVARRLCREMNEKARAAAAARNIGGQAHPVERNDLPPAAPGHGLPPRHRGGQEDDDGVSDSGVAAQTSFDAALAELREAVARGMLEDFREGGQEALAALRTNRPHEYFKLQIMLLRMEGPGADDGEAIVTELRTIIVDPLETGDSDENEDD